MNEARQLPARDYLALKAAVRDLVTAAGGANRAAELTRSDAPRLSRYGSPHEAMHAPLDVIADLEAEAGAPIVTAILADMQGFNLVPQTAISKPDASISLSIGEAAKDFGAMISELAVALADGNLTEQEAAHVIPLVRELATEIAELDQALEAKLSGRVVPLGRAS